MKPQKSKSTKRYNLVLPEELFTEVQQIADRRGISVVDVFRQFTKLGLLAYRVEEEGGSVIIRKGDYEQQILLL